MSSSPPTPTPSSEDANDQDHSDNSSDTSEELSNTEVANQDDAKEAFEEDRNYLNAYKCYHDKILNNYEQESSDPSHVVPLYRSGISLICSRFQLHYGCNLLKKSRMLGVNYHFNNDEEAQVDFRKGTDLIKKAVINVNNYAYIKDEVINVNNYAYIKDEVKMTDKLSMELHLFTCQAVLGELDPDQSNDIWTILGNYEAHINNVEDALLAIDCYLLISMLTVGTKRDEAQIACQNAKTIAEYWMGQVGISAHSCRLLTDALFEINSYF